MTPTPLNILAVDDDISVTTSVKLVLKRSGCNVDVLNDSTEALARLKELPPDHYDIIITDHAMPKMTGLEFLQQLPRSAFPGKVLVLSAYLDDKLEAQFLAVGANKIMRKPFEIDVLRQAIESLRS